MPLLPRLVNRAKQWQCAACWLFVEATRPIPMVFSFSVVLVVQPQQHFGGHVLHDRGMLPVWHCQFVVEKSLFASFLCVALVMTFRCPTAR